MRKRIVMFPLPTFFFGAEGNFKVDNAAGKLHIYIYHTLSAR